MKEQHWCAPQEGHCTQVDGVCARGAGLFSMQEHPSLSGTPHLLQLDPAALLTWGWFRVVLKSGFHIYLSSKLTTMNNYSIS